MELNLRNLKPAQSSKKKRKTVGRGHGCHGKTSGRGGKGQTARSGGGKAPGFEGGQTPWFRRLPKFKGFKSLSKVRYTEVSLDKLSSFEKGTVVTPELLLEKGIIKNLANPIKVLANGVISKPLTVRAHKLTKKAVETIEKAGGKVEVI